MDKENVSKMPMQIISEVINLESMSIITSLRGVIRKVINLRIIRCPWF